MQGPQCLLFFGSSIFLYVCEPRFFHVKEKEEGVKEGLAGVDKAYSKPFKAPPGLSEEMKRSKALPYSKVNICTPYQNMP